jgi:hypothetical protein
VKRILIAIATFALAAALCGCQKKQASPQPAPQPQVEPKKVEFVPPVDSTVTIDQMKKWLSCNPNLDSLSIRYKDSLSTHDAAKQTKYQEDFVKAQDRICVRLGLLGGYAEYLWILKNAGNPKNARVLDSLKLSANK